MNILVDIGNTNLKYVEVNTSNNHDKFSDTYRISSSKLRNQWLDEQWLSANKIIVASVSKHSIIDKIQNWCLKHNIELVIVKSEKQRLGIQSGYSMPEQLGVDRWLALIAARSLKPNKNVMIIDSGTATTVDILISDGQHLGGWILPGITSMQKSILQDTANVDAEDCVPNLTFGKETAVNVSNACWAATQGLINVAKNECKKLNLVLDEIIITGGNSKILSLLTEDKHINEPQLIFYGLKQYL